MTIATTRARNEKGAFLPTHGMRNTRLYGIWCAMKHRCNSEQDKRYSHYGGRGIKVCVQWETSFEAFAEWAFKNGYEQGLTIDRMDNNKGYSPQNCRWVSKKAQNRNYRRNHLLTYNGKTQCIADWADEIGIKSSAILQRLKSGKSVEDALMKIDWRSLRWKKTISQN